MELKRTPHDFLVEELPSREWAEREDAYWVYKAIKRGLTTPEMVRAIARANKTSPKRIRYAGLKDKHATTVQYLTSPDELKKTGSDDVKLEHVGYTSEPLTLGELDANHFRITVYDVDEVRDAAIPNYYGDQRFSTDNKDVGLLILKEQWFDAAQALAKSHPQVRKALSRDPGNPIGAIQTLSQKILLIYVHSVQSWLYNEAVSQWVADEYDEYAEAEYAHGTLRFPQELPDMDVPLVGAAQDLGEWSEYYEPLLEEAGIAPHDFRIDSLPYLTQEGTLRSLAADVREKEIEEQNTKAVLDVTLGPGCYATVCISGWFA